MNELKSMLDERNNLKEIAAYLDPLSHGERMIELRTLHAKDQKKLFSIAGIGITVDDMVEKNEPPLKEIIFYGHNSLPAFNSFQKRMCRSEDGSILWGYNEQAMKWITGPGYFVVPQNSDRPGEVMIDYTHTPPKAPSTWPAVASNEKGISRLVYGGMKDYMRRVSLNVFIGEATKNGKVIDAYFILCRE